MSWPHKTPFFWITDRDLEEFIKRRERDIEQAKKEISIKERHIEHWSDEIRNNPEVTIGDLKFLKNNP